MSERNNEQAGREAADGLRAQVSLGAGPVTDIAELIERRPRFHVLVAAMPPDSDGLTAHDPVTDQWIVAVATTTVPFRQRLTLAHELGHIELGELVEGPHEAGRTPAEIAADAFARHLLAPLVEVARRFDRAGGIISLPVFSELVRHFRVSPEVMAHQLKAAGHITASQRLQLVARTAPALATEFGWRADYDAWAVGSNTPRPPRHLLEDAVVAYRHGCLSVATLARIRQIPTEQMQTEMDEAGLFAAVDGGEDEADWFNFDTIAP